MQRTRTSGLAIAAAATGVAGGTVQIGKALPAVGATANVRPAILALIVVTGLVAVAGGLMALRSPVTGGLLLGAAGVCRAWLGGLGLLAVWAILLVVAIRQRHQRLWLAALAAPFATVASAWAVVAVGGEFLGWQP